MKKLLSYFIICMSFSTAHALTYEQAETYSVCGVALTGTDTVAESGDDGFVTTPTGSVILPDDKADYVEVDGMKTSGLGSNSEGVNILNQLKKAVGGFSNPNDLMYWYVTAGTEVTDCSSNSFQCDYNKGVSVVLGVWLPQDANEVTISFTSRSKNLSMSVWSYDYEAASGEGSFTLMSAENNVFGGHQGSPEKPTSYSKTISGNFTGQYIFFMFNTANGEQNYLDIQGMDITYTPVNPDSPIEDNPFQPSLPVPEPSGAMLSLLALASMAARRRR